jgi:hypothetical protein
MILTNVLLWPRLRPLILALTLVSLLTAPTLTTSVSAQGRNDLHLTDCPGKEFLSEGRGDVDWDDLFAVLRDDIERSVPAPYDTPLLAQADAAQIALLLPAVQAAREAARNQCAAVHILTALQQHNQTLSARLGYDGAAIDQSADEIKRYIFGQAWPTSSAASNLAGTYEPARFPFHL